MPLTSFSSSADFKASTSAGSITVACKEHNEKYLMGYKSLNSILGAGLKRENRTIKKPSNEDSIA